VGRSEIYRGEIAEIVAEYSVRAVLTAAQPASKDLLADQQRLAVAYLSPSAKVEKRWQKK
jgi:hypothetical protein